MIGKCPSPPNLSDWESESERVHSKRLSLLMILIVIRTYTHTKQTKKKQLPMVMTTNSPSSSPSADDTLPTTTVYKSDDKHVINDDDNSSSSDSGKRKDPEGRGTIDVYDSFVNGYNNDDGHVTRGVANDDDDDDDERLEEIDNNNNNDNNNNSDAHDVESTTSEGAPSVASLSSSYSLKSLPEQQQQQHQQQDQESLERQRQVPAYVRHMEEDVTSDRWKRRSKHIFILSDAGKPIFTRYGNENDLNTKMSFFQVIVNFVAAGHDTIRYVHAESSYIFFSATKKKAYFNFF